MWYTSDVVPTLVILESPFATSETADQDTHVAYARRAAHDSLMRGEAPMVSHLLYTQPGILDDKVPDQRQMGIEAGLAWGLISSRTVVYQDYGISRGMKYGIESAINAGRKVEYRTIGLNLQYGDWEWACQKAEDPNLLPYLEFYCTYQDMGPEQGWTDQDPRDSKSYWSPGFQSENWRLNFVPRA